MASQKETVVYKFKPEIPNKNYILQQKSIFAHETIFLNMQHCYVPETFKECWSVIPHIHIPLTESNLCHCS
jgi:hypothetical protein